MASDLIALSGALLLQAGVVGVTLTDTGKVEAYEVEKKIRMSLGETN